MPVSVLSLWSLLFLRRNIVAFMAFLGCVNIFILRVNLSVAIVAMTKNYTIQTEQGETQYVQDFDWNSKEKGTILGSFFYGYLTTQIIGGWLGTRLGGARLFGSGLLVTTILNLAIPYAAYVGVGYIIAIRVIEGIFEGVTFPCLHVIWGLWAPLQERTRLASFAISGCYVGILLAFTGCGFLAQNFGWPSIFYITGVISLIWCILWFYFVSDDPKDDRWITETELKHIQASLTSRTTQTYPWKAFLTSMPVWAIVWAHFCENWGTYTMITQLPIFIEDTLNFDMQTVGILSAAPYVLNTFMLPISGFAIDKIRSKAKYTNTQVRKFFNSFAFFSQTVFIIGAAFVDFPPATILLICLAISFGSISWSAFGVNLLDIAPQYAGVLMGFSNTFGTLPGFISPTLTGYIVKHKTKAEWRIIFFITGLLYLIGGIFYLIFASGEKQSWAKNKDFDELQTSGKMTEITKEADKVEHNK